VAVVFPENYKNLKNELSLNKTELIVIELFLKIFDTKDTILILNLKSFPDRTYELPLCIIDKNIGVIFFKFVSIGPQDDYDLALKVIENNIFLTLKTSIKEKLASHRQLQIVNNGQKFLKIPFGLYFFVDNLSRNEFKAKLNNTSIKNSIFFIDDFFSKEGDKKDLISRLLKNIEQDITDFSVLSDDDINAILFQIAPEYTIPRYIEKPVSPEEQTPVEPNSKAILLSGEENFVHSWRLDQEQINLVNSLLDKHELILACAGSGKSVLLLSRAIKIAKVYPDKKILVTFFNRALRTFYDWRFEVAGINVKNLVCKNIHQLCYNLLQNNHVSIGGGKFHDDNFYSQLINRTRRAIKNGFIKERFFAIFIDEIQDFEHDWYRLCLDLLEDREKYILCVCGDVTQDIKGRVKRGAAPWQGRNLPNFRGRSRTLKKNYRNSFEINKFTENFLYNCIDWVTSNYADEDIHEDDFNVGDSEIKTGIHPIIHQVDRDEEAERVLKIAMTLNDKYDVPYSDIAVLYPYQKFTPQKYWIRFWLKEKFDEHRITYSEVQDIDKEPTFYDYAQRRGITLSAMDSIKGLDFMAIVICGLLPFKDKRCSIPEEIFINIKRVYTSMTRAMKHLHIILTNSPQQDVITKMIINAKK